MIELSVIVLQIIQFNILCSSMSNIFLQLSLRPNLILALTSASAYQSQI